MTDTEQTEGTAPGALLRSTPAFTIGVEEEYLLIDRETMALVPAPEELMTACAQELQGQVAPEFLQAQIEIGTRPCATVAEAGEELRRLRAAVARHAARYNLAPIAASCHPFADWKEQHHTRKPRYDALRESLGAVARRLLICGMHVHVGIDDDNLRNDLMPQVSYFLPHLLALSTSSPFWQGEDTGLASYRLTVFDALPRTGLPPQFSSWAEYRRATDLLIAVGELEDATKIWWDLRPSARFPTLEVRICDVMPRLTHALALVAMTQSLMRFLWRLREQNMRWRVYERFLIQENRWRAQRYGISEGLIDFGRARIVPMDALVEEIIDLLGEDAEALGCRRELEGLRTIMAEGTSAERQRQVLARAMAEGADRAEALRRVVAALVDEFTLEP